MENSLKTKQQWENRKPLPLKTWSGSGNFSNEVSRQLKKNLATSTTLLFMLNIFKV